MIFHLLRPVLLITILSQTPNTFSQKGVYELVNNPKDAPSYPGDEFPVYGYKATFKLKGFHKLKYTVTDAHGGTPLTYSGSWKSSGKTINISFWSSDSLISRPFEQVKLKSGNYIKPVNDYFHYYRKQ